MAVSFEPADVINQVMSFGSPTPIEVVISGPNQEDNRVYAEKVAAEMRKIPTLRDLQFGQAFDYPRIKVEIDRERAGLAGLTVADAANAMIAATSSSRYIIPVYWADPKTGIGYQVQLQVPPAQMNSNAEVGMIPVKQNEGKARHAAARRGQDQRQHHAAGIRPHQPAAHRVDHGQRGRRGPGPGGPIESKRRSRRPATRRAA